MTQTFRDFERLKSGLDFQRTRREGRRRVGRCLVLWARLRGETPPRAARLGIVVSRRNGIAARRNLFKRRLRDIFRRNKGVFPRGWDFVVASASTPARPSGAKKAPLPSPPFPPPMALLHRDFLDLAGKTL